MRYLMIIALNRHTFKINKFFSFFRLIPNFY